MSEERRAAPAPKSAAATAPELDSASTVEMAAIDPVAAEEIVAARPGSISGVPPSAETDVAPARPQRDSSPRGRRRGRVGLRIPDDEVSRPTTVADAAARSDPPSAPGGGRAQTEQSPAPIPVAEAPVAVMPMRIISIGPTAPEVVEAKPESRRQLPSEEMIPIEAEVPLPDSAPESIEPIEEEVRPPPPPPRVRAPSEPEGEEVRFDDDVPPAPATARSVEAPPSSDGRSSDPGAELGAEDLEPIESAPAQKAPGPVPPMRPRLPSQPAIVAPPSPPKPVSVPPIKRPLVIVPPHVGMLQPQPTETSGLRRKGRLWWEDLFNDDYLRTCEKLTDEQILREVDFIEDSLGIEQGGALLDLACGTGRHAIELARRGYEVVGFDLSLAMLAKAGDEAQDIGAKLNFVQGDMRDMTFEEQFDGVYCWNTSFGYFEEDKNVQVIDRIHHALKSGGLLLLDVANRDFLTRQSPSLAWFEGDGCVCMDEMALDFITSRMKVKRTIMLDDGRTREIEYSLRVYSLHELGKMLHEHGFKVTEVSGRVATPGVYFGNESPRTLVLAEKR